VTRRWAQQYVEVGDHRSPKSKRRDHRSPGSGEGPAFTLARVCDPAFRAVMLAGRG